jgi:nitroreductase
MNMTLPANEKLPKKNIFEAILARRSVRAYALDEISRSTVQTLLEAAVRAPTAMHEESWAFAVAQDRQILKQLSDRAKPLFVEEARHRNAQGINTRLNTL